MSPTPTPSVPPKPVLKSSVPSDVVLVQYSRWVSADFRRLFIVLDAWHGLRAETKLLDVQKQEEITYATADVLALITDGSLLPF